jgi:hypothetical protein
MLNAWWFGLYLSSHLSIKCKSALYVYVTVLILLLMSLYAGFLNVIYHDINAINKVQAFLVILIQSFIVTSPIILNQIISKVLRSLSK